MPGARNRVGLGFAYAAAAFFVFAIWVWGADTEMQAVNGDRRSTLDGLIYGTAHNPFVQRVLVPFLTRTVNGAIPSGMREEIRAGLAANPKFQREAARLGWDLNFLPEYLIAFFFSFLALLLFPFILRALFGSLYDTDERLISIVPLASLFALPPFFFVGTHYIYDFPALLFFTLGLLLMVKRKWLPYYALFVVGCLNKETMILLLLPLALIYRNVLSRRQLGAHAAVHLLLFGLIKASLMLLYANNPGGAVEFHLFGNISKLLMPYSLGTLLMGTVVGVLIWFDFRAKHPVLRQAAWLLVPFLLLMFCFAWINEARDLYELFPIYVLLMAHTVLFSFLKKPYALRDVLTLNHTERKDS
jgi:hypothetical protein